MNRIRNHSAATSADVARRAGVSQSAVSLVLAGKATGRVGKPTQEAILHAARELRYRPNSAARTLRVGRSRLIVLAVPDVSNPYFAAVLQGAEQAARKHDYSVMLSSVRDEHDWRQVVLDALSSRSVDGFLLFTMCPPTAREERALRGRAVIVDASSRDLPVLRIDVETGMRAGMIHLLRLGHTNIAHLAAAVDAETFHLRKKAYLDALEAAAILTGPAYQARAPFAIGEACQAARKLLEHSDPPSAIVCDSDVLAVGVYKAARELRRMIPSDISVVGFDDGVIARTVDPELTTVTIPTTRVGEQALLLLLAALEGVGVPSETIVPLELTTRGSTQAMHSSPRRRNERRILP